MKTQTAYYGIDVSKTTLHLATPEKFLREIPNTLAGHRSLANILEKCRDIMIVVEASGVYERKLCEFLQDQGVSVHVAQPGCVRHFAKSLQVLAKTDRIDAQMIARFGSATRPRPTSPLSKNVRKLRDLSDRRAQIVEDRVRESNRLEMATDPWITKQIRTNIKRLEKQEKQIEDHIQELRQQDQELNQKAETMMKLKGVGDKTANILLAHLPELGSLTRQQIAALAGLAPYSRESGQWKGKRTIYGGRAAIRKAMFLAARVAKRWCPVISAYFQSLKAKGKPYKVAIIACARKLLTRINTLLKNVEKKQNGTATT